jgi:signal transduction histidine kinase
VGPGLSGRLLLGGGFVVCFVLLDWVSFIHPLQAFNITPWNPPPALIIMLLVAFGITWLPLVFGTILASEFLVRGLPDPPLATALLSALLAACYGAIAVAVGRVASIEHRYVTLRDLFRLIVVVIIGALCTGVAYIGTLVVMGLMPLEAAMPALVKFWIGDGVGILVLLPLLLMATDARRRQQFRRMVSDPETLLQAVAIGLALWVVFGWMEAEQFKYFYVLFLPLVWVGVRHGLIGAAMAVVMIQGGIILAVQLSGHPTLTVFELQTLLLALVVTGFALGTTVDERRRADEDLRQSLRLAAAGEMAAALAHELNQPLTALSGYARSCQLLADAPGDCRRELNEALQKLIAEARRSADVVRRLRDFFRTGSTRLEAVSLARLAQSAAESMAERALASGVAIECSVQPGVPEVLIDPVQIEVVLRNLVANAVEAAAQSVRNTKTVAVEVRATSGFAQVSVIDSGAGIAADQTRQLFEPFVTTKASGMGLGLAISRAVIEGHGGRLWAEAADQGIFRFTLPIDEVADGG